MAIGLKALMIAWN